MNRIIVVIVLALTVFWITSSPLLAIDQVSSDSSKVSGSVRDARGWMGYNDGVLWQPWEAIHIPSKLPAPKNAEWIKRLKSAWISEIKALAQFEADQEKFNAFMPYFIVLPQTAQHISWIEHLLKAYGLALGEELYLVGPAESLKVAFEKSEAVENELATQFEWLVRNAQDRDSALVLDIVLLRSRFHYIMFEHSLRTGKRYAFGMRGMTGLDYGYSFGKGISVQPFGNGHLLSEGKLMRALEAESQVRDYLKSSRNPNLRVGKVKDAGKSFEVEVITRDDSLVDKILVDKSTGWMRSAY